MRPGAFVLLRIVPFAALALLLHASAIAQLRFGVFGGSVATEFSGIRSEVGRFRFQMGYTVGGQLDYRLNKDVILSIGPSLKDERGTVSLLDDTDPENTFFKDSFDISIKQLEIPVTFRIVTSNERWHFIGGLSPNLPLSLRAIKGAEFNGDDFLRNFNLSYLTGIGFRLPGFAWGTLHLEVRYSQSLTHLTASEDPILSQMKSSDSSLTVVYFPPWGKP